MNMQKVVLTHLTLAGFAVSMYPEDSFYMEYTCVCIYIYKNIYIYTHTHTVFNIIQCFFYMKDHKKSWLLVMANCKKTLKTNAFKLADIKWRLFF